MAPQPPRTGLAETARSIGANVKPAVERGKPGRETGLTVKRGAGDVGNVAHMRKLIVLNGEIHDLLRLIL